LKGTTNELLKQKRIQESNAGVLPKEIFALSKEYAKEFVLLLRNSKI
jgi:hypothetical protein